MINFDFDKHCCGCAACADACSLNCISIKENKHGFRIPYVDTTRCVSCGKCDKVCPVLNVNERDNQNQKCYCSFYLDEKVRNSGSSGSMFFLIAEWVISNNGVVFGAAFDEKLQLRHTMAASLEELWPLMKSKYLQSDTTGVFEQVKKKLQQGVLVLFVGTPCQCQALFNYLDAKIRERLYLIDFICHGVPSQHLFNRYIKFYEKRNKVKVISFSFRQKSIQNTGNEEDVRHYKIVAAGSDGKQIIDTGTYDKCSFYLGFKNYQIFRNSCYECKFVGNKRITDYTLGDFWHLTEYEPEITDFNKGYSEFIVNSDRGNQLFESLKDKVYCKEYSMDIPLHRNYAYNKPSKKYFDRNLFFFFYNKMSYNNLSCFWPTKKITWFLLRVLRKL